MFLLHKFKLRQATEPCILVGPTIKQAKRCSFTLDGTQVSLAVPKQHTSSLSDPINPRAHYEINGKYLNKMINSQDGRGGLITVFRNCDFYGPLFGGSLASMSMAAGVVTPRITNDNISKEEERNWLDRRNIYQLIDDVIDSLEVTLSDEARAQQAKALEGLNDTSLTTSYPPIDFSKMDGNEQSYQQLGQGVK